MKFKLWLRRSRWSRFFSCRRSTGFWRSRRESQRRGELEAERRFRLERDVAIARGGSDSTCARADDATDQCTLAAAGESADERAAGCAAADEACRALTLALGFAAPLRGADGVDLTVQVNAVELCSECSSPFETAGGVGLGDRSNGTGAGGNDLHALHDDRRGQSGVEAR